VFGVLAVLGVLGEIAMPGSSRLKPRLGTQVLKHYFL
jgi:hypothetical protein